MSSLHFFTIFCLRRTDEADAVEFTLVKKAYLVAGVIKKGGVKPGIKRTVHRYGEASKQ